MNVFIELIQQLSHFCGVWRLVSRDQLLQSFLLSAYMHMFLFFMNTAIDSFSLCVKILRNELSWLLILFPFKRWPFGFLLMGNGQLSMLLEPLHYSPCTKKLFFLIVNFFICGLSCNSSFCGWITLQSAPTNSQCKF